MRVRVLSSDAPVSPMPPWSRSVITATDAIWSKRLIQENAITALPAKRTFFIGAVAEATIATNAQPTAITLAILFSLYIENQSQYLGENMGKIRVVITTKHSDNQVNAPMKIIPPQFDAFPK